MRSTSSESPGVVTMQTLWRDLRYAVHLLKKSPGFTAVAMLTLALAIGANAVVFGVMNSIILRPLRLPQEDSLYGIQRGPDNIPAESYPDYLDLRDRNGSFDGLAVYSIAQAGMDSGEKPYRAFVFEVSGNYFDVLRIQPYLGRFFRPSDEKGFNSAPYAVLSYTCWHTRFQNDSGIVGRTILVNKHPFTVVGVAPPAFHGTILFLSAEIFVPIVDQEQIEGWNGLNDRGNHWVHMALGHLKAGVTPAQAIADLNSIGSDLEKTYPKDDNRMVFSLARPGLYGDVLGRPVRLFLTGLMLLAGLILLAACANLGSLFAARAADRSREVALRLALGAGRLQILRQLFTEALMISLLGGAVGLWASVLLLRAISVWQPFSKFPINMPVHPDAYVYVVALLLALASGFLFGAVPVRQVLHADPYEIVKSGTLGKVGRRLSVRDVLLGVQIAICAVLVTSSLVAVRGLVRSTHSNFGFEPRKVLLADTDLTMGGYGADDVPAMQKRMLDAISTIPGVESAGLVDKTPLSGDSGDAFVFADKTADLRPANAAAVPLVYNTSPEYFRAAGTTLLSGRNITWHDDKDAPHVAVINGVFANKVFGSPADALGSYFKTSDGKRTQVVGIVEDGKYTSLTEDPKPTMFLPILQSPSSQTYFVVRSSRDPQQLTEALRSTLRQVDSALPFFIQPWTQQLDTMLFPSLMATMSLGVLGGMGAVLSVTGVFGMAAYSVSKRLRELGIRMALGAQRKEVLRAALGRAVKLLAFGSASGLLLGILASRILAFIVYTATPRDPLVLAGAILAMSLLGLLATWIPAQRALSIDPAILLREE